MPVLSFTVADNLLWGSRAQLESRAQWIATMIGTRLELRGVRPAVTSVIATRERGRAQTAFSVGYDDRPDGDAFDLDATRALVLKALTDGASSRRSTPAPKPKPIAEAMAAMGGAMAAFGAALGPVLKQAADANAQKKTVTGVFEGAFDVTEFGVGIPAVPAPAARVLGKRKIDLE